MRSEVLWLWCHTQTFLIHPLSHPCPAVRPENAQVALYKLIHKATKSYHRPLIGARTIHGSILAEIGCLQLFFYSSWSSNNPTQNKSSQVDSGPNKIHSWARCLKFSSYKLQQLPSFLL